MNRNKDIPECSSPPCYLHEIDPAYAGLDIKPDKRKAATPQRKGKQTSPGKAAPKSKESPKA